MAKEVSDYANVSMFEVLNRPAVEILGMMVVINAKNEIIK